jgi:recombinational DNA repair protein (RecF pathway)
MKSTTTALGLVLRADPHREADIRLEILTAEGVLYVTATGAQKPTAKLKHATQIFTTAEFEITANRLTGARVLLSPMPLTREINRYYLAHSIAGICAPFDRIDPEMFTLTIRTFDELINTDKSVYIIFIEYFGALLKNFGFDLQLKIPNPLGLTEAKKLVDKINETFVHYLDHSIPCIANLL